MDISFSTIWSGIDKGGTLALALFGYRAFMTGAIVPRWVYNQLLEQNAKLEQLANRGTELSERATNVAEKKIGG